MARRYRWQICALACASWLAVACVDDEPQVTAASGAATRVVTLAPHLAEMVAAVDGTAHLVGVSAYSDFPLEVTTLPVIGDAFAVDKERLAELRPDLVLAWESGTPTETVRDLRRHGYRVDVVRTRTLSDIGAALEHIGGLLGKTASARDLAAAYLNEISELRQTYANRASVRVYFQISEQPLYTINGEHYISELITVCGGRNVFAELGELAPAVSAEAVIVKNPEVMLSSAADDNQQPLEVWERWPELAANRYGSRFGVPADLVGRASPRLARAGQVICEHLETARRQRAQVEGSDDETDL